MPKFIPCCSCDDLEMQEYFFRYSPTKKSLVFPKSTDSVFILTILFKSYFQVTMSSFVIRYAFAFRQVAKYRLEYVLRSFFELYGTSYTGDSSIRVLGTRRTRSPIQYQLVGLLTFACLSLRPLKVGEYSDIYDTCTKVSEKREIARLVVEAVYSNGGRFLDANGEDIGFKRSMDKAMKALKDRRHIKSRKTSHSAEAIKKHIEISKEKKMATNPRKKIDPLSTDDAGHALLLLRNSDEDADTQEGHVRESESSLFKKAEDTNRGPFGRYKGISENMYEESRRQISRNAELLYQEHGRPRRSQLPPSSRAGQSVLKRTSYETEKQAFPPNAPRDANEDEPVLWQSVIVSRESPQASIADLLVNAKQRLDALSSVQQAVSAPICLIYPPHPNLSLAGQLPIQTSVPLDQFNFQQAQLTVNQELLRGVARAGAR